jgi:hypothetical protein
VVPVSALIVDVVLGVFVVVGVEDVGCLLDFRELLCFFFFNDLQFLTVLQFLSSTPTHQLEAAILGSAVLLLPPMRCCAVALFL